MLNHLHLYESMRNCKNLAALSFQHSSKPKLKNFRSYGKGKWNSKCKLSTCGRLRRRRSHEIKGVGKLEENEAGGVVSQ